MDAWIQIDVLGFGKEWTLYSLESIALSSFRPSISTHYLQKTGNIETSTCNPHHRQLLLVQRLYCYANFPGFLYLLEL
ncbi:hypothetical protein L6452_10073 [Arctium lappa]|uniref:Uncharacterized protein n=1 Tax=Arctium lappa TaxID=4217 RepID=A0ACB9DMK2_ARCLA|nr:hypothetical protein L6452_10073 [Arctium lappa]